MGWCCEKSHRKVATTRHAIVGRNHGAFFMRIKMVSVLFWILCDPIFTVLYLDDLWRWNPSSTSIFRPLEMEQPYYHPNIERTIRCNHHVHDGFFEQEIFSENRNDVNATRLSFCSQRLLTTFWSRHHVPLILPVTAQGFESLFQTDTTTDAANGNITNTTTESPNKVYNARGGTRATVAPALPAGQYDPCNRKRPPETAEEIFQARADEEREQREADALWDLVLRLVIIMALLPTVILPLGLGMTPISFPFAALYKFLALNSIPEQRYYVIIEPNLNVEDLEFPFWAITEDLHTFLHACCCYAARQAHTYEAAGISPFWVTFKKAMVYNILSPFIFAEYRYELRNKCGFQRKWDDLTVAEQRLTMCENFLCCWCYAYQEARQVDDAMRVQFSCCCQVTDNSEKQDDSVAIGIPVRAASTLTQDIFNQDSGGIGIQKHVDRLTAANVERFDQFAVEAGEKALRERIPDEEQSLASRVIQDVQWSSRKSPTKKSKDDDAMSVSSKTSKKSTLSKKSSYPSSNRTPKGGPPGLVVDTDDMSSGNRTPKGTPKSATPKNMVPDDDGKKKSKSKSKKTLGRQLSKEQRDKLRLPMGVGGGGKNLTYAEQRYLYDREVNREARRTACKATDDPYKIIERAEARRQAKRLELNPSKSVQQSSRGSVSGTEQTETNRDSKSGTQRSRKSARGPKVLKQADGNASDGSFSTRSKPLTKKTSTAGTSETTVSSEIDSSEFERMEEKATKKKIRQADKSFFDNRDDISNASTRAKRIARVKLPKGVLTRKQFKRLNEDKIRKLFMEADEDRSGSIRIEELAAFLIKRFGTNPSVGTLRLLMKEIDENNDDQIDEDEFVKFFSLVGDLSNNVKLLNDKKRKKMIIQTIMNISVILAFILLMIFGIQAARQCEEICEIEGTCLGQTRTYCTFKCIEPKEDLDTYVEYDLMPHLFFWLLTFSLVVILFFVVCIPQCCYLVSKFVQPEEKKLIYEDEEEEMSPYRLRQHVRSQFKLIPPPELMEGIPNKSQYHEAEREQALAEMTQNKTHQLSLLGGHKHQQAYDPRIQDPLRDMEKDFATDEAFMAALAQHPLEPIAWLPPGLADDFVANVIEKDEKEEARRQRKRDAGVPKKKKKKDQLMLADAPPLAGESTVETNRYAFGAKRLTTQELAEEARDTEMLAKNLFKNFTEDVIGSDGIYSRPATAEKTEDLLAGIVNEDEANATIISGAENPDIHRTIGASAFQEEPPAPRELTVEELEKLKSYQTPITAMTDEEQRDAGRWHTWEQDFRRGEIDKIRIMVENLIASAKTVHQYKNALEVAIQYSFEKNRTAQICAFDEDDIRRMKRRLRGWEAEEEEKKRQTNMEAEHQLRKLEDLMKTKDDPDAIEATINALKQAVKGTRKHARMIAISEAELPVLQKRQEEERRKNGGLCLSQKWCNFRVAPEDERTELQKEREAMMVDMEELERQKAEEQKKKKKKFVIGKKK